MNNEVLNADRGALFCIRYIGMPDRFTIYNNDHSGSPALCFIAFPDDQGRIFSQPDADAGRIHNNSLGQAAETSPFDKMSVNDAMFNKTQARTDLNGSF